MIGGLRTGAFATFTTLALALGAGCGTDEPVAAAGDGSGAPVAAVEPAPEVESTASRADRLVAAAVLAQFAADPALDASAFEVSVEAGVATIGGTTDAVETWQHARDLASRVPGVAQVLMSDPAPEGSGATVPDAPEVRDLAAAFPAAIAAGTPPDTPLELPDEGSGDTAIAHAASGDRPRTYVVQAGDSLSIIAQRTMGDGLAWPRIYELNRSVIGSNPQDLRAGMELRIPQD